ncbi:MAG TPA: M1 family aminopeptidase [Azospirillaceae bacterium]|nr:M1 family aminopeptidase [Azospirillaceae bacterium]
MFLRIARFELGLQLRSPTFWVGFLSLFAMTFMAMTIERIQIGSGGGTHANSPFAIIQVAQLMSIISLFIAVVAVPGAVLRDLESGMAGITFSLPLRRAPFLLGRLAGAYGAVVLAFLGAPLGMALGSAMWWLDPETLGPFRPDAYLQALLLLALPNLLFASALFLSVAAVTRSQMAAYVALIGFLVLWFVVGRLMNEPDTRTLEAVLDPFGGAAIGQTLRYWTVFERNGSLLPLSDAILWNRALWLAVSLALVGTALTLFRFETQSRGRRGSAPAETLASPAPRPRPPVTVAAAGTAGWRQFAARTRLEARAVLKSPGLLVMLGLGLFNTVGSLMTLDRMFGTPVHPVTRAVTDIVAGAFGIVPMIVVVYYAAELVWRDRQARMHEIVSSCPVPGWVFVASKTAAMALVLAALFAVGALSGMAVQLVEGPVVPELDLYLGRLFLFSAVPMLQIAVLATLVQAVSPNKFAGIAAMVGYILLSIVAEQMGLVDNLLFYADGPEVPLSDMNGWGHFAEPALWFMAYWSFAALAAAVLAHRLWPAAVPAPLRLRLRGFTRGWTPVPAALGLGALVGMAGTGGWIAYNTHGLNEVVSADEREARAAAYERRYRQYEGVPQPRIVDVKVDIDLHPSTRSFEARGRYVLENDTGAPVPEIHLAYDEELDVLRQEIAGAAPKLEDRENNYFILALDRPMEPGERRELAFETRQENPGFTNDADITRIVGNGSFVDGTQATPYVGFSRNSLMQDRQARRRQGLDPIDRMAKLEDESRWTRNDLRDDSDFVTFETTVSTEEGQTAVAPGYLQKEWSEGGRRYFHYRMDTPILNFYAWLSADYKVVRDRWGEVELAVFHHAPHDYNVGRMMQALKDGLDYFTANFGPYQHRQLRILEFPAYARFAQAFPNTVPFSEAIGFIADNRDPATIDYAYYVTAHELAHQWWGHQVTGADVQGAALLSETLAQYSALAVMEKAYGPHKIRRFLKYELDRYLRGRGGEDREEMPLVRVENQQYLHYQKGSLVMYALKDRIGEAAVNRALARLVREHGLKSDPYPRSVDLVRLLRAEAGPEHQEFITDLFERIVLYDLKVEGHTVEPAGDGRWKVRLTLAAAKAEADGQGRETPRAMDDPVDIGVFAKDPEAPDFAAADVLYLEKHRIDPANPVVELVVDRVPRAFGIDPYNKLIDRNSDDNLARHRPGMTGS